MDHETLCRLLNQGKTYGLNQGNINFIKDFLNEQKSLENKILNLQYSLDIYKEVPKFKDPVIKVKMLKENLNSLESNLFEMDLKEEISKNDQDETRKLIN